MRRLIYADKLLETMQEKMDFWICTMKDKY